MRWTSIILAVLVLAALAAYFWPEGDAAGAPADPAMAVADDAAAPSAKAPETAGRGPGRAGKDEPAVPVMVLAVAAEETAGQLSVSGRTEANRRVEVSAETEGLVISEPRRRGERVKAGAVLCRLDPGARPAQLAEAEAMLAKARADASAADSLSAKGFTAETTRIARQAELEAAEAAVDLMEIDIERLAIAAPFDGILETDTAELGQRLALGSTCATLIDLSTLRATGFVSEQVVDRISPGQGARVRLVNGLEAEGRVSFIASAADEDTRTYEIEVTLPNEAGRMRDGMTAEILLPLAAERAHRIPQSALTLDDDGRLGVRLADGGRARFAPVSILSDDPGGIWVNGLPETALVIVVGQEFVREGGRIAPQRVGWDDLG